MTDERRYPRRPLLGIGALIFDSDRILLVRRGTPPLMGQWSLPGGLVEAGEPLKQAVRREVFEETGLEVEPLGVLEVFERIMRDSSGAAEYHYVLIDYICRITGGSLCAGDDACGVEWVAQKELPGLDITEGTRAVIEKGFQERYAYQR